MVSPPVGRRLEQIGGPQAPGSRRLSLLLLTALAVVGLAGFNPIGWDRFGPLRWFALPALGFTAVALRQSDLSLNRSWLTKLWIALLGWGAVAAVVAADPLHAWIGTPDRRFGWLTWLLCGTVFLVARQARSQERDAIRTTAIRGFAAGSCLMSLYALAELAGWTSAAGFGGRLGGPFGQPAFLGAASVLAAPICAGLFFWGREPIHWRYIGAAGMAGALFTLLGAGSRAAWLGAVVSGLLWLLVQGRKLRRPRSADAGGGGSPAEPVGVGVPPISPPTCAAAVGLGLAMAAAVIAIPDLRVRLTSATGSTGVLQGRIDEWQVGLRALRASPVVGYGPEGYRTAFGRHVDEQYVIDWGRDAITDRAHSGLLDVGLAFGVPGLLIFVGLMFLILRGAAAAIGDGDPVRTGLAVGVIGYIVQQQFLFPLSELDPVFWLAAGLTMPEAVNALPAAVNALPTAVNALPTAGNAGPPTASAVRSAVGGLAIGLTVVVTAAGALDLVADSLTTGAIEDDDLSPATRLRPDSIRYRFIASRVARQDGDGRQALQHIEDGLRRSPNDPALRGEQARLLLDIGRAAEQGPNRAEQLNEALLTLEALVADDPHHPDHLQRFGVARALTGDVDGAIDVLEQAEILAPNRGDIATDLAEARRLKAGG